MRHLPLAAFAIAVLTIPFLARASRAAQPVSETVLVCVGGGGESLVVEEWTAERIAAARERGRTPPRVHPETGTCDDPAGLSVALENAGDAAAFLCSKDANGEWRGPDWIVSIYVLGDEVPPAPTTGDCPAPLAYPRPQPPETERAAALVV